MKLYANIDESKRTKNLVIDIGGNMEESKDTLLISKGGATLLTDVIKTYTIIEKQDKPLIIWFNQDNETYILRGAHMGSLMYIASTRSLIDCTEVAESYANSGSFKPIHSCQFLSVAIQYVKMHSLICWHVRVFGEIK